MSQDVIALCELSHIFTDRDGRSGNLHAERHRRTEADVPGPPHELTHPICLYRLA